MSFLRRLGRLFTSEARASLERLDNPAQSIEDAYQEQLDLLGEARERLTQVLAAQKKLELQAGQVERARDRYLADAQAALVIPDEPRARRAIGRANQFDVQLDDLRVEIAAIHATFEQVERAVEGLRARTEAIRHQKEITAAKVAAARASITANGALGGIGPRPAEINALLREARDQTESLQARAAALSELVERGTLDSSSPVEAAGDVERRLREAASDAAIDAQLAGLRQKMLSTSPDP